MIEPLLALAAVTPLSCDERPADFHAERAVRVAEVAYADERILDPTPATGSEKRAWRKHRLCLADRDRRRRIGAQIDRLRAGFDAYFVRLITPPGPGWLASTRACESGTTGGYLAVSPSGIYVGAYQFDAPSWTATASTFERLTGLEPNSSRLAEPREQDIRAAIYHAIAGPGAWPVCG